MHSIASMYWFAAFVSVCSYLSCTYKLAHVHVSFPLRFVETCWYLSRVGNDLALGIAPETDQSMRGPCYTSDGHSIFYAGGDAEEEDIPEGYLKGLRVFRDETTAWEELDGDKLKVAANFFSSVRLGDKLWCIGGYDGVRGVNVLLGSDIF